MRDGKYITIMSDRTQFVLNVGTILYVLMNDKNAEIHMSGGKIYKTRMKISGLEEALGGGQFSQSPQGLFGVRQSHPRHYRPY